MSETSTATDIQRRWVSLPVAQSELGITERTVYRRVERGQLLSRRNASDRVEIGLPVADSSVTDTASLPVATATVVGQPATDSPTDMTDMGQSFETWRADLISQLESSHARASRLEEDKAHLREQLASGEQELRTAAVAHGEELSAAREEFEAQVGVLRGVIAAKDTEITARDSRISDLTGQVSALEAKVREVLEKGQDEALRLADRIADLVERQQEAEVRIYELQPVAERVPMLEAAVDEKDAALTDRERKLADIHQDIETIAGRPVAGPVFRLLTKGKLRR